MTDEKLSQGNSLFVEKIMKNESQQVKMRVNRLKATQKEMNYGLPTKFV